MNDQSTKLPTSFWIIAAVGTIWNLMGVMSFVGQTFMSDEAMAALPEDQQALYAAVPSWMTIVFAVAVLTGTLGCVGLLMKKSWAVQLFMVSLVAIVIQMIYNLFMSDAREVFGPTAIFMPLVILIIGAYLYYYSKQCQSKGWLT